MLQRTTLSYVFCLYYVLKKNQVMLFYFVQLHLVYEIVKRYQLMQRIVHAKCAQYFVLMLLFIFMNSIICLTLLGRHVTLISKDMGPLRKVDRRRLQFQ